MLTENQKQCKHEWFTTEYCKKCKLWKNDYEIYQQGLDDRTVEIKQEIFNLPMMLDYSVSRHDINQMFKSKFGVK